MDSFDNKDERSRTLRKIFAEVYKQYPLFVTQQEAAKICNVDNQTIRKWEKDGGLPFTKAVDKLLHFHQISLDDLLGYFYEKNCLQDSENPYVIEMRRFYEQKYKDFPDRLYVKDVATMTGYVKQIVAEWMHNGHLKGYNRGKPFLIPKKYLIDFVCGPYYRRIIRKSNVHKTDMQSFLEQLRET
jgi:transcriptional regulator with XRE-family HTH domain